jgi:dTDP-4-amino-4,6-dideoxygalactose transaminase
MLPRYIPGMSLGAWTRAATANAGARAQARAELLQRLGGAGGEWVAHSLPRLRDGLYLYFRHLREQGLDGEVLLSAQICPSVVLAVNHAGLRPRFVDVDVAYPTPNAKMFAAALSPDTVCVVVAPMYGLIQADWSLLLARLDRRRLVLDLAQGLGLWERLGVLVSRADALGYSFAVGKGLDTGGALVLSREQFHARTSAVADSRWPPVLPLGQGLAMQLAVRAGAYGLFARRLDEYVEADVYRLHDGLDRRPARTSYALWWSELQRMLEDIGRARKRTLTLRTIARDSSALRFTDVLFDPANAPIRPVVRVADAEDRDRLLGRLRRHGIDCVRGGEPTPDQYLTEYEADCWPNARKFRQDSLRLPFLGRLGDDDFRRLVDALTHVLR